MVKKVACTQADLARRIGVTQRTVSRVFATPDLVAETTRERVLAAAERLGYRPHASARAMRSRRSGQVVLLQSFQPSASQLPWLVLSGLLQGLGQAGLSFGIARFGDEVYGDEEALPKAITEVACDGVIINYDTNVPPALERALTRHRIPAIWLNAKRDHDVVRPDDEGLARILVAHLHDRGHRTVLYADTHLQHTDVCHYSRHDRLVGVRAEAKARGMILREWLPETTILGDSGPAAAAAWQDATAAIGYSGLEISCLLRGAALRGQSIVPCATFADEEVHLGLPIATAIIPAYAIGEQVAAAILAKMNAPQSTLPAVIVSGAVVAYR